MKSNNVDKALIGMGCGFIIFLFVLLTRWIRNLGSDKIGS